MITPEQLIALIALITDLYRQNQSTQQELQSKQQALADATSRIEELEAQLGGTDGN